MINTSSAPHTGHQPNGLTPAIADHNILSQGAEGRLYIGDIFGMNCVVKERFQKKYRVKELDEKLTKQRILQVRVPLTH
jgi:hypothetical protein